MADTLDTRISVGLANQTDAGSKAVVNNFRSIGKAGKDAAKEAGDSLDKVGKATKGAADFTKSFAESLTRLPLGYAAAGTAAAAFAVASFRAGAQTQRAIERISQGVQMTGEQLSDLGNKTREWAEISGESYASVLESYTKFQQASDQAPKAAEQTFTRLLKVAQVTGTNIDTLAESVNTASRNLNVSKMDIMDSLTNMPSSVSQAFATSLPQLSRQMSNVGLTGSKNAQELKEMVSSFTATTGDAKAAIQDISSLFAQMSQTGSQAWIALQSGGGDLLKTLQNMERNLHTLYKNAQSDNAATAQTAITALRKIANQYPMLAKEVEKFIDQEARVRADMAATGDTHAQATAKIIKDMDDQLQAEHKLEGAWHDLENSFSKALAAFYVPEGLKAIASVMDQMAHDAEVISKMPSLLHNPLATSGDVSKDLSNEAHQYSHGKFLRTPTPDEKNAMHAGPLGWRNWAPTWMGGTPTPPHRAGGGPVSSGQPYVVGENGPELFVPSGSGNIATQGTQAGFRSHTDDVQEKNTEALQRLTSVLLEDVNNQAMGGASPFGGGSLSSPGGGGGLDYGGSTGHGGGGRTPGGGGGSTSSHSFGPDVTGPSTTKGIPRGMSNRAYALMNRLIKVHGWTPQAAAIAAGQAEQESGIRPFTGNMNRENGGGMFQWRNERFGNMRNFRERHKDLSEFDAEVDFFAQESQRRTALGRTWPQQHDLSNAGRLGWDFERYGDNSTGNRVRNAHQWLGAWERKQQQDSVAHKSAPLHPEHQSMLNSYHKMKAEMEKPIRMSVIAPKPPPQLGAMSRRIAQRRSRQTAEDTLAYMRYTSTADFFA